MPEIRRGHDHGLQIFFVCEQVLVIFVALYFHALRLEAADVAVAVVSQMSTMARIFIPSITSNESSSTWPSAPQPMSAMLILLRTAPFATAAGELESGLHEVNSSPAPAAAVTPIKSRRVMGSFTIFEKRELVVFGEHQGEGNQREVDTQIRRSIILPNQNHPGGQRNVNQPLHEQR